jgi:hypothetical protein
MRLCMRATSLLAGWPEREQLVAGNGVYDAGGRKEKLHVSRHGLGHVEEVPDADHESDTRFVVRRQSGRLDVVELVERLEELESLHAQQVDFDPAIDVHVWPQDLLPQRRVPRGRDGRR